MTRNGRALLQPRLVRWHGSQRSSRKRPPPATRETGVSTRQALGPGTDATPAQASAALKAAAAREATLHSARMSRFTEVQIRQMEAMEKQRQKEDYQRRYKKAARWWLKIMVGLPIFIISSWHLFNRLALGNHPPEIPWPPPPPSLPPYKNQEEEGGFTRNRSRDNAD
ncbi:hypothetical protein L249_5571 [Ophiocordyceps polyrhachis-furcata BCC 54312]|uniref:Transmembrane protein n=1 Tax=Ophiocordyceps polyrhachis-furcata BCC 54312 TaxID=1330021 RepID=A0A367LGV2_9HYPO|nr:hypothetical protein L249_5571 [Ophiocordyceps polyrhachis-furcata BCC 54312]